MVLRSAFGKGFTAARLRLILGAFFVALALPIGALVLQAYQQLKWEAYHQYRGQAEELTRRIDTDLLTMTRAAESRSFADYGFLTVAGDPSANFLQRSPLARYPVVGDLAGSIGYFQVGPDGDFSTPLLPARITEPEALGISADELAARQALADRILGALSDNRLVDYRPDGSAQFDDTLREREQFEVDALKDQLSKPQRRVDAQIAFDGLNKSELDARSGAADPGADEAAREPVTQRKNARSRVADLKLDSPYEKKSAEFAASRVPKVLPEELVQRVSRKEKSAVPEPASEDAEARLESQFGPFDLRINTFESEVDPLDFSLLDSGHLVVFRKVWRDGERHIQGVLLDQRAFLTQAIEAKFAGSVLSAMSDLVIAYREDVLSTVTGGGRGYLYESRPNERGALLYRTKLSAPLNALELIYTVRRLPPGPGAEVLGWVTLLLAVVFCGGFYALYRAGLKQIALAAQQQDFVSAVTHELKTPLTSIRMYGEMLKEGWADAEKKQTYYEYIHDESERLGRLISNVLQLANLSREDPHLEIAPVAVGELMARIESKIAEQIRRADFTLAFATETAAAEVAIAVDEDCCAQIVINLVDNAIKFSRNADVKRIEVGCRLTRDKRVVLSVRDHGPGIAKGQMKKIFDMFYRSESELTRETVGTGIGLAIVNQLATAMGAKVDVLNREPGAEFQVSFATA